MKFDDVAAELIVRLNSNAKLPSLYQQLELLGPLLDQKYGGPLGMPRLHFVHHKDGCEFSSRSPGDFYEGDHAIWTSLTSRESTELRKHLIDLLTQWLNTKEELAPQPLQKLSFQETCEKVQNEFAPTAEDKMLQFYRKRWRCFEAAFDLVFDSNIEKASVELATLLQFPVLERDDDLWSKWPFQDAFYTLSSFRRTSNSALGLAQLFSQSIYGSVQFGKLDALRTNDVSDLTDEQVLAWWNAARKEAHECTLAIHQWSLGETFRDRDILQVLVDRELLICCPKEQDKRMLSKPIELALWDRNLLLAMYEMKLYGGNYASSKEICAVAKHPTCHKEVFDKLKDLKLVTKPENKKGRMLTELGLAHAKKLTEHQ